MLWFVGFVIVACVEVRAFGLRPVVPLLDGRIVGGSPTTIEKRPYQLSLQYYGSHICGASVIDQRWALTAAHCTSGMSSSALSVRAGSTYRGSGGVVTTIRNICQNPSYNPSNIDYDVSVLGLSTPLSYSTTIQPIKLQAVNAEVPIGASAIISGWGTTSEGGSASTTLQEVSVPRVTDQACRSAYGSSQITARMICFGFTSGGRDSCQGDSGGPLNYNEQQVGIVSWGYGCARPAYPGVYTKVSNAAIASHIQKCTA
ncbi:hypothetical protein RN001_010850 [Aquatica leii]|uniref:Peptidase S1 domain-containing protein n=1 Tax=Aquatica leii TaxID=1421715 RepID=A0AAN7PVB5_9COLE|nr:hypothetical protein RN001_010850 [Aquatica leii]